MIKKIFIFCICAWILTGCQVQKELEEDVFAVVNGKPITVDEFVYTYASQIRFMKDPFDREHMNHHGGKLIRAVLFSQFMEKQGLYDPQALKEEEKDIQRKAVIDEMINAVLEDSVRSLSEDEVRDAYLKGMEHREVRHLFSGRREDVEQWHQNLLEGTETFHSLSHHAFQDTFLQNHGGYLGFITYGDMIPEFEEMAFNTNPGEISKPFKTPFGWHILKVESVQKDVLPTEDDYQLNREKFLKKIQRVNKEKFLSGFYESLVESHRITPDSRGIEALTYLMMTYRDRGKDLVENITAPPTEAFFNDITHRSGEMLDQPVIYYDDDYLTLRDLLPLLENVSLALLYRNPSQAALFAVRDELVYQMGVEKGFLENETVQMKTRIRRMDWLSKQFITSALDTLSITYPVGLNKDEQAVYANELKNTTLYKHYLTMRENADIQTDMSKIYDHYDNFNQTED
jgi:hypothetical protein